MIDGSALLVLGAFGPFASSDAIVTETLQATDDTLVVEGGVHRYLDDEYYGGGLWVVLAGALSAALASRDPQRAEGILDWIESTADSSGQLPEQVTSRLRMPQRMSSWVERWGQPARPLLWSHAMYLLAAAPVGPRGNRNRGSKAS